MLVLNDHEKYYFGSKNVNGLITMVHYQETKKIILFSVWNENVNHTREYDVIITQSSAFIKKSSRELLLHAANMNISNSSINICTKSTSLWNNYDFVLF